MKSSLIPSILTIVATLATLSCSKSEQPVPASEPGYDYSKAESWMILPSDCPHEVDMFFIYPTCVSEITDTASYLSEADKITAMDSYYQTAAALGEYTNVFGPYYRQVGGEYIYQCSGNSEKFLGYVRRNGGKADIFAALDYYFKNYNNGRPFILAGHSQGSAMTRVVLDEYMKQHPEYYSRMVAAYAIGFALPKSWLAANPHIKTATGEADTGVVIGWNTQGPKNSLPSIVVSGEDYLINPLTWTTDASYGDKKFNLGTLEWDSTTHEPSAHYYPGIHDARIDTDKHVLICTTATKYAPGTIFGDEGLHVIDWSAYYDNLRVNGRKRIEAYLGHAIDVPVTDYSKSENWLRLEENPTHDVDVFYLLPTTVMHSEDAPTAIHNANDKLVAEMAYAGSTKTFEGHANIYAPYYRQAYTAIVGQCADAEQLEYYVGSNDGRDDAFAALDWYFEHYNNGKPFILAAHSQGSAISKIVFKEYFSKHPDYLSRLVAAYCIGFSFPKPWFDSTPTAKYATGATETGVIIAWNTEGPGCTTPSKVIGKDEVLINPLNWKTGSDYVGTSANHGSYVNGEVVIPGTGDAQIDANRGALICTTCTEYLTDIGEKSLHNNDWQLYYVNIRENAIARMTNYLGHEPR